MLNLIRAYFWGRKRRIFKYWNGRRIRRGDPIAIAQSLSEHPMYLRRHLNDARAGDADAWAIVADAARHAFGIPDQDAGGLTTAELVALAIDFEVYAEALKKNAGLTPGLPLRSAVT